VTHPDVPLDVPLAHADEPPDRRCQRMTLIRRRSPFLVTASESVDAGSAQG